MSDIDEPRRRRPDDDEDRPRRRPPEDDDEDRPRRPRYLDRRPGPQGKTVSVIGIIALVIGVISFVLSLMPCLNVFTWPLAVIGGLLALIGILISAIGQREGLSVPLIGIVVNVLAIVVTVGMYVGFCGLSMQGAKQAQQAAQQQAQREEDDRLREEVEQRDTVARNAAAVAGLAAGPNGAGALLCLPSLAHQSLPFGQAPDALVVDLDTLVREFETNDAQATRKYVGQTLIVQGIVDWGGKERGHVFFDLKGPPPGNHDVECKFDDPDVAQPDLERLKKQRVTVQGQCNGRSKLTGTILLDSCRLLK